MYADLNDFIADLNRRRLLARVAEPVSADLEIAAVTDRACKVPGGGPALLFEQPSGFDIPVATNLYGSVERMCLALGVNRLDDLAREIDQLMTPQMPEGVMDALKLLPMVGRLRDLMPKTVRDAPCHEVVERDGTLDSLPILKCWPEDGGKYITFPLVFTKDPETGVRNIGTYRMQVYDGRSTGMHWQRHKGGAQHYRVAERLGRRLDVAVALGAEPVLPYCATAPMPEGLDELLLGGFLSRRRIELVKCVTVDLEVPASAHIVLEGYVEPGERRREGPFGDGSLQQFVPADFEQHYFTLREDAANHERLRQICLFDLLANNADRKSGHCLFCEGSIYAIDNGLSFHVDPKLRTVIWDFSGARIPPAWLGDIERVIAALPKDLGTLLSRDEREALVTRGREVIDAGVFPADNSGMRYPWPLV